MLDFHAHILPGADHGCDSLETALRQLELARAAGIDTIVATPHFYPQTDRFSDFLELREQAYSELMAHYAGPVRVLLGAEVHMCVGLDHLDGVEQLCIPGTRVMLCELSFRGVSSGVTETFERMTDGLELDPILAHVDRYDPVWIDNLFAMGLRGQVNAEALCRHFGRRRLLSWIDSGSIVALGSDIHMTEVGYSQYTKAVDYLGAKARTVEKRVRKLLSGAM